MQKRGVTDIAQISKTIYEKNKGSQNIDAEQTTARNKRIGREWSKWEP